ncbi:MAG: UDP-N-acetylmuramoyl-L-alanine--D-glutamate ligase, partial [Candidatus Vogelbacteria bacterium]|nr:UDP-N-acetylmuramoyl-L-alanine--D-glutamate ligase [Candidatus Vogelbacteria bacterium]
KLDPKIFKTWPDSFNGHIPISAIIAFVGALTASLSGQKYLAVANEQSSNFGNVSYDGEEVNHQWSKSSEFEDLFQNYLNNNLVSNLKYFSPIRPYYEIRVVEMFSGMKEYFPIFTSCNRNFRIHFERPGGRWCGECPKCAFMFVLLGAFLTKDEVIEIFGKNMLEDESLLSLFRDLLGLGTMKPFDCVGTFDEMQVAFELLSKKFADAIIVKKLSPELKLSEEIKKEVFKYHEAPNLSERFKFLGVKNVLILGYGLEGKENEKFLKTNYPGIKIGIADAKDGPNYLTGQENYDLGIKTAGMPRNLVKIPYATGTNIFLSRNKNLVIGVTGSKGKSTTASLIYEILKVGGKKVKLLGNIGQPMLHYLDEIKKEDEILVIEFSSYQLEDIKFSPNIAVATNLFPEHLDYHNGLANYYEAKKNIIKYQTQNDWFIYSGQVKDFKNWAKEAKGKTLAVSDKFKIKSTETALLGQHNLGNINLAVAVAKLFKIPESTIRLAIKNFKPLPHRLEFVGEFQGLKFYDDAISTAPESTLMAISALKNIGTIFLGGTDRGYDFTELEKEIRKQKIKNIVLFPESGKRMFKKREGLNILETTSMEEAVKFAYNNTKAGQIVLLSTASPSYGLWKNFEEKGDQFKKYVTKNTDSQ